MKELNIVIAITVISVSAIILIIGYINFKNPKKCTNKSKLQELA